MSNLDRLHSIKNAIRNKYAWPGGYPLFLLMADGEALSIDAARDHWREICRAVIQDDRRDSWFAVGAQINYEDSDLYCAHTGARIEAAYPPV